MATMTEKLDANKTSKYRTVRWTAAADPKDPASGTMEVWDGPTSRPRRRCYAVVEVVPGKRREQVIVGVAFFVPVVLAMAGWFYLLSKLVAKTYDWLFA